MRLLFHTRTSGDLDWQKQLIQLGRLPSAGEYIIVNTTQSTEAEWHEVKMVAHVADVVDHDAAVYCNRVGPRHRQRLPWTVTLHRPVEQEQTTQPKGLFTVEQAAAEAQVSDETIRRLIKSSRLRAIDFGTQGKRHDWRITPDSLTDIGPVEVIPPSVPAPRRGRRSRAASGSARQYLPNALPPAGKS